MLFYSRSITPRLRYIVDFIGRQLSGHSFVLTDKLSDINSYQGPCINYSSDIIQGDHYQVYPHGLLSESNIREQLVDCTILNGQKVFFQTVGDLGFDLFAASFYLLSRYEEYLTHPKDIYGRYAHENSIAFKEDFLDTPLVNRWIIFFGGKLEQKFPGWKMRNPQFKFLPTYDIDEAWSYQHKSWWRNTGAGVKEILKRKWEAFLLRRKVIAAKQKDPFDSYEWMDDLHQKYNLNPKYFFLVAARNGKYDRNILPEKPALREMIQEHQKKYAIGIHPSWQTGDDPKLFTEEIETLSSITGTKIDSSRQHFIRFTLPQTFRELISNQIKEDFSMGYGSINGFRASVCSPFYWYDLSQEEQTGLLLYPFCYMEANSFYEQKSSAAEALLEMRHYYKEVKKAGGLFISIWHNTFLGTDKKFRGWREVYEKFISEIN